MVCQWADLSRVCYKMILIIWKNVSYIQTGISRVTLVVTCFFFVHTATGFAMTSLEVKFGKSWSSCFEFMKHNYIFN